MSEMKVQCGDRSPLGSAAVDLAQLGTKMFALSLDNAAELMKQSSAFWISAFSRLNLPVSAGTCCDIPEKDCPPRCACELHWAAAPGEKLKGLITVTNRSKQA